MALKFPPMIPLWQHPEIFPRFGKVSSKIRESKSEGPSHQTILTCHKSFGPLPTQRAYIAFQWEDTVHCVPQITPRNRLTNSDVVTFFQKECPGVGFPPYMQLRREIRNQYRFRCEMHD
jgi:hypothetical protein